jgi:hypothetical protein
MFISIIASTHLPTPLLVALGDVLPDLVETFLPPGDNNPVVPLPPD